MYVRAYGSRLELRLFQPFINYTTHLLHNTSLASFLYNVTGTSKSFYFFQKTRINEFQSVITTPLLANSTLIATKLQSESLSMKS